MPRMSMITSFARPRHGAAPRRRTAACRGPFHASAVLALAAAISLSPASARTGKPPVGKTAAPAGSNSLLANTQAQFWFGVAVENIPPAIARQLKLKPEQGVMVIAVFAGSPAEKAGIRPDDLLIELNGAPLTSQEDLAKAANTANPAKMGASKTPPPLMRTSEIAYLRLGDRAVAHVTPEQRPADMLVSGANLQKFSPAANNDPRPPEVRNIVLSNGNAVQYGPGYQFDSRSQGNNVRLLQQAVGDGQTIIMTQETDESGNVKNTISDGRNTYAVEQGKLDQIPVNYRPLAQQMLAPAPPPANAAAPAANETTDDRLQRLERQNEELKTQLEKTQTQLDSVIDLLKAGRNP